MGAGILPVALYRGALYILLGQERHNNLWCDFGGRPNKGEKPFKTGIREGAEELNGILGTEEDLDSIVSENLITSLCYEKYTTYVFKTKYNVDLPLYFKNINSFAEKHLKDKIDNHHNGLFEKRQIRWVKASDLRELYKATNVTKVTNITNVCRANAKKRTYHEEIPPSDIPQIKIREHYKALLNSIVNKEGFIIKEIEKL